MDETHIGAAWAALVAEAPEHAKSDLPQMQRIFYAGAAATYDAMLKATYGASGAAGCG